MYFEFLVTSDSYSCRYRCTLQTTVVRKVDNSIHWINRYLVNSVVHVCFTNSCPLDSDLSGGKTCPPFEQPGPGLEQI